MHHRHAAFCTLQASDRMSEQNTRYAKMRYTQQSGNEMAVARHKHATVLLEQ